ncbi:hypothetical protein F2P56_002175 [Juglans regia]|uniref:Uncharacterized protein LOC109019082 n=2 Tax=Juglans regia TaxID=51240 RepID=A0A2I4HL78_JUGRE|nr:uncharacterized protein LOC109019082 [Juglans regia]KAF5481534.1 hypothetical protein F2P56_002175 [Juglans regia]
MTHSRISQNPGGAMNQDNQNPPMDGGLAETIRLLADMLRQQEVHVPRPEVRGCMCEKFLIHRYPKFSGSEEPLKAEKWIMDLVRTYEICGCTEDQKVLYAGYLFQGEARIWWDMRRQLLVRELGSLVALSCERFKEEFDNILFLDSVKQLMAQEFTTLTQGSLTIEQYATEFMALGRFAPHLISTQ